MSTKIFVSQIDSTNPDGSSASANAFVMLTPTGTRWVSTNEALASGPVGYQGSAGAAGPAGPAGVEGIRGPLGYQGSAGETGPAGPAGAPGLEGDIGLPGYNGSVGYQGSAGAAGPLGPVGYTGSIGDFGLQGDTGYQGSVGYQGSAGEGSIGYQGSAGYFGSVGYQGSAGGFGEVGYQGSEGAAGQQGEVGYQGSAGEVGYQGSAGVDGGPGLINFKELIDVPQDYAGNAGRLVRVKSTEDGLEFEANTFVQTPLTENINGVGFTILNVALAGYSEEVWTLSGSSSPNIDPTSHNVYIINLDTAVSTITLSNSLLQPNRMYYVTLILQQDGTGNRTVDWSNQTIYWPSSENMSAPSGPPLSTAANYTDVVTLYTYNQGTYWIGVLSAKGFPTV